MSRFRSLGRLAAAAALAVSAATVAIAAPAGAGSSVPAGTATGTFTANPNGTVTVTYSDLTSPYVEMFAADTTCPEDPVGQTPLHLLGGDYTVPASPGTIGLTTNVWSAGASVPGAPLPAGSYAFCLYDMFSPGVFALIADGGTIPVFPPVTGSMVDDGNGTITLTYANFDRDYSQVLYALLVSGATTCPAEPDPGSVTGFGFQDLGGGLTASPMSITVGTMGVPLPLVTPTLAPVTAGSYAACLYYTDADTGNVILQQTLVASIHTPVTPIEPVKPSFTG